MGGVPEHAPGEENTGRQRRQPSTQRSEIASNFVSGALVTLSTAAVGYGAYQLFKYLTLRDDEDEKPSGRQESQYTLERSGAQSRMSGLGGFLSNTMSVFWTKVESQQQEQESETLQVQIESETHAVKFCHKYNQFDCEFQNLIKTVSIQDDARKKYNPALKEILSSLEEMMKSDPLFKCLFRTFLPAGSAWEYLRICCYNEFDLNVVLFPNNIQSHGVDVIDKGRGYVEIKLQNGFNLSGTSVSRKCFGEDDTFSLINNKLQKWLDGSSVSTSKVLEWMQSVVDIAILNLKSKKWKTIKGIKSRSRSGPAVTVDVSLNNTESFSIDLVPVIEFDSSFLPYTCRQKYKAVTDRSRKWTAVPKGPRKSGSPVLWRTSLYEAERDLMRGKEHLKPCVRIMKRLRDIQNWKQVSSYYIKTHFMWLVEKENFHGWGLGKTMMHAMKTLEEALRAQRIPYYWDDSMNLLEDVSCTDFFLNVANYLLKMQKEFERSLSDKSIDPMRHFTC